MNKKTMHKGLRKLMELDSVKRVFLNKGKNILLVENSKGTVLVISGSDFLHNYGGYQVSMPIKPNLKSGSGVGISDYMEPMKWEEVKDVIENQEQVLPDPSIYTPEERESIRFLTIDEKVAQYNNILGFVEIKKEIISKF